jgi:cAMP phosphodiesterase
MNMHTFRLVIPLSFVLSAHSQTASPIEHNEHNKQYSPSFRVIPLGVKGGLDESDLSAYMLAAEGTDNYICLDAGTLRFGILKAIKSHLFNPAGKAAPANPDYILRRYIRAYLISHPHLDHVAGLIINSPDDTAKNIYGLPFCLDVLRDNYFTWKSWANFSDQGDTPALHKYHYAALTPGLETPIANTTLSVRAFPLSHSKPNQSTAFLVRSGEARLLYLGDTGADTIEHSDKLHLLWQQIAPLIRKGQLKAIFIEVSFPNEQPERLLFGHLTPQLLVHEMQELALLVAAGAGAVGGQSLKGLPVVITHIKPSGDNEELIKRQLAANNPLGLRWIFPGQAQLLEF